ncbi:DUF3368 domain-containing protein [Natrialbaceae archaeon A-arb3/5]
MSDGERLLLIDASTFITLAEIGACGLLYRTRGRLAVPGAVRDEVSDDPAESELIRAIQSNAICVLDAPVADGPIPEPYERASEHLDPTTPIAEEDANWSGDIALLGQALDRSAVVVSDDKPLRDTCKALSIPVSGSIGILVRAVERGDASAAEAKDLLLAMDDVGARLSARLLRRAERLIDDAAGDTVG